MKNTFKKIVAAMVLFTTLMIPVYAEEDILQDDPVHSGIVLEEVTNEVNITDDYEDFEELKKELKEEVMDEISRKQFVREKELEEKEEALRGEIFFAESLLLVFCMISISILRVKIDKLKKEKESTEQ